MARRRCHLSVAHGFAADEVRANPGIRQWLQRHPEAGSSWPSWTAGVGGVGATISVSVVSQGYGSPRGGGGFLCRWCPTPTAPHAVPRRAQCRCCRCDQVDVGVGGASAQALAFSSRKHIPLGPHSTPSLWARGCSRTPVLFVGGVRDGVGAGNSTDRCLSWRVVGACTRVPRS